MTTISIPYPHPALSPNSRWTLTGVTFAAPSKPARVLVVMEAS